MEARALASLRLALALVLCTCGAVCVAVAPAAADEAFVEVLPEVFALNEEGVKLAVLGKHDEAIERFEQSLALQDLNITWVNLGRARARAGDCDGAREAYGNALAAPRVADPTPQQVVAAVDGYLRELETQCKPADPIAEDPVDDPVDTVEVPVDDPVDPIDPVDPVDPVEPPPLVEPAEPAPSFSPWSYVLLGTGGAMLIGVVVIDQALLGPAFDDLDAARSANDTDAFHEHESEIETLQTTNYVLLGVGGASLIAGTVLLVLDLTAPSDAVGESRVHTHTPVLHAEPGGATLGWHVRW